MDPRRGPHQRQHRIHQSLPLNESDWSPAVPPRRHSLPSYTPPTPANPLPPQPQFSLPLPNAYYPWPQHLESGPTPYDYARPLAPVRPLPPSHPTAQHYPPPSSFTYAPLHYPPVLLASSSAPWGASDAGWSAESSVVVQQPSELVSSPAGESDGSGREEDEVDGKKKRKRRRKATELPRDAAARRFKCETCGKLFARPSALSTHERSHSKEKPHICPDDSCSRAFAVLSNLRRHQRIYNHGDPNASASGSGSRSGVGAGVVARTEVGGGETAL